MLADYKNSDELCSLVAQKTNGVCLLSFSRGKDSIAAWLQLRRFFKKIYPIFRYLVPHLKFEDESLKYFEDFFGTRIIRLPHPSFYRWLNNGVFQFQSRFDAIKRLDLPYFEHTDASRVVQEDYGLSDDIFTAVGVRSADNINRYLSIKRHGAMNENDSTFFPVYDWKKERLLAELKTAKIKLPVDYKWFGRTFDGLDYRFIEPLRRYAPEDYQRLIFFFPYAVCGIKRMEYRIEKAQRRS